MYGLVIWSIREGRKPGVNFDPSKLHRTAPRHHADMASLHLQQELILAADLRHDALRLAGRRDVIRKGDHIHQVRASTTQVHPLPTDEQLPLDDPILPVELPDE